MDPRGFLNGRKYNPVHPSIILLHVATRSLSRLEAFHSSNILVKADSLQQLKNQTTHSSSRNKPILLLVLPAILVLWIREIQTIAGGMFKVMACYGIADQDTSNNQSVNYH